MVCMGNICRSPTAEGVLRHKLQQVGLGHRVAVDSAGTHPYHVGDPPDGRAVAHARRRGYDLSALRGRQVELGDFERFDLVLAMDDDNLAMLEALCPPPHRGKLRRLTDFARRHDSPVVPDPYYCSADGFERVLDLVEDACDGLVEHLRTF
jgi:protein-tyrosine phosphatase